MKPPRDLPQQLVADGMAEDIVDLFEAVEVEAEQPESVVIFSGTLDGEHQAVGERGAIRQVGQRIVMRHVRDAFFRTPALGHIVGEDQQIFGLAVPIRNHDFFGGHQPRSRGRAHPMLAQAGFAGLHDFSVTRRDEVCFFFRQDVVRVLAEGRLTRHAEKVRAGPIAQQQPEFLGVFDVETFRNVVDHRVEKGARALQLPLRLYARGDVLVRGYKPAVRHRLIDDRRHAAVAQLDDVFGGAARLHRRQLFFGERFGVADKCPGRLAVLEDLDQRAPRFDHVARHAVHLNIAVIAQDQPPLAVQQDESQECAVIRGTHPRRSGLVFARHKGSIG